MESSSGQSIFEADVFAVSDKGSDELKGGSTRLPSVALQLLVTLDGKTCFAKAAKTVRNRPSEELRETAKMLLEGGYIRHTDVTSTLQVDFSCLTDATAEAEYALTTDGARAEAEVGTNALKLNGYYVSIARRAAEPVRPSNAERCTVLVIEDSQALQLALEMILKQEGFAVRQATNRGQIVAQLCALPLPDAILLDVMLPDVNGFDVLSRVRQHPQLKHIPVIMLTALASREAVLRGLASAADGYITKPFDRERLITGVKAVLGFHASASVVVKHESCYGSRKH